MNLVTLAMEKLILSPEFCYTINMRNTQFLKIINLWLEKELVILLIMFGLAEVLKLSALKRQPKERSG